MLLHYIQYVAPATSRRCLEQLVGKQGGVDPKLLGVSTKPNKSLERSKAQFMTCFLCFPQDFPPTFVAFFMCCLLRFPKSLSMFVQYFYVQNSVPIFFPQYVNVFGGKHVFFAKGSRPKQAPPRFGSRHPPLQAPGARSNRHRHRCGLFAP